MPRPAQTRDDDARHDVLQDRHAFNGERGETVQGDEEMMEITDMGAQHQTQPGREMRCSNHSQVEHIGSISPWDFLGDVREHVIY